MTSTIRERLVQSLTHKRAKLMKEKEQLDIADTNALLLHPSQFSITNPSSPGGQPSRKTRFRGNRADPEELGNGFAPETTHKRKRRAPDDDLGSPSRNGVSTPAERARSRALAVQTAPLYSIHSLFTEKELAFQSHHAQIAAKHFFSTSQREGEANGAGKRGKEDEGDKSSGSGNNSDAEDDDEPGAADMERTASQNVHVTRSTRNAGGLAGLNILSDLAEKAASRPTLPYATLNGHGARNGVLLMSPSRLMDEEIEEDLIKIADITASKEKHQVDKKLIDAALKPLDGSRSNLAPDWPTYLDVHLVDIDPRRKARALS
jgi:Sds3-like